MALADSALLSPLDAEEKGGRPLNHTIAAFLPHLQQPRLDLLVGAIKDCRKVEVCAPTVQFSPACCNTPAGADVSL